MKIALIGFGKMGHEIESIAREQGDTISAVYDSRHPVDAAALASADMCIDFSTPQAALANIHAAVEAKRDIVVGTTGWHQHLPELKNLVNDSGLLYSANFSLGMNYFFRVVRHTAQLLNRTPEYDPYISEIHHRQKVDSPSGTALRLGEILLDSIDRKKGILAKPAEGRIAPEMLHITSTRAGVVAGTHSVGFDSEADFIELKHVAKTRRGFALGALAAARWLRGRKGIFTMDDVDL